jgi:hypothetical protein
MTEEEKVANVKDTGVTVEGGEQKRRKRKKNGESGRPKKKRQSLRLLDDSTFYTNVSLET